MEYWIFDEWFTYEILMKCTHIEKSTNNKVFAIIFYFSFTDFDKRQTRNASQKPYDSLSSSRLKLNAKCEKSMWEWESQQNNNFSV